MAKIAAQRTPNKRIRVLLADDHLLVLEGFRVILSREFDVVGVAENGREAVAAAKRLKPDVLLLDISLPLLNGLEVARKLHKVVPEVKIVFLTMHSDVAYVTNGLRTGASGYLLKQSPPAELYEAVRAAVAGRRYVTSLIDHEAYQGLARGVGADLELLTNRQREVLQLVAEGLTTKDISASLHVSGKTVEYHKANIKKRLGVASTAELARYAVKQGMIDA